MIYSKQALILHEDITKFDKIVLDIVMNCWTSGYTSVTAHEIAQFICKCANKSEPSITKVDESIKKLMGQRVSVELRTEAPDVCRQNAQLLPVMRAESTQHGLINYTYEFLAYPLVHKFFVPSYILTCNQPAKMPVLLF